APHLHPPPDLVYASSTLKCTVYSHSTLAISELSLSSLVQVFLMDDENVTLLELPCSRQARISSRTASLNF
ncbi:hypothetical protein GcM1_121012, partial [Golovinomyces cichoracearum]